MFCSKLACWVRGGGGTYIIIHHTSYLLILSNLKGIVHLNKNTFKTLNIWISISILPRYRLPTIPKDKRVIILLKARICDIFHSRFNSVNLEFTNYKQTSVFMDILGSFGYEIQKFQKKTKFIFLCFMLKVIVFL